MSKKYSVRIKGPKKSTRVTQNEISLDPSGVVYWRTGLLEKKKRIRQFEGLGAFRRAWWRGLLDS